MKSQKLYQQLKIIGLMVFLCFANTIENNLLAQDFVEVDKLTSSQRHPTARFGSSVAVSGDFALIGAESDCTDVNGQNARWSAGAVYAFKKDNNGKWVETQKIVPSDRADIDLRVSVFGVHVSIYENHAAIMAYGYELSCSLWGYIAFIYLFERDEQGIWHEKQKISKHLECENAGTSFLKPISVYKNTFVFGVYFDNTDFKERNPLFQSGSAFIYEKDTDGLWKQVQKISAQNRKEDARFGLSVSLSDSFILVGSIDETDSNNLNPILRAGALFVFKKNTNGLWEQTQKITAPDRKIRMEFSNSVSHSENTAVVGSWYDHTDFENKDSVNQAGSAYILNKDLNETWKIVQKITPSQRLLYQGFGFSIDNSDEIVLVSPYFEVIENSFLRKGSVYAFGKDVNGIWTEFKRIKASDSKENSASMFGFSISLSGNTAFVGAQVEAFDKQGNDSIPYAGATYVFEYCLSSSEEITDTFCGSYTLNNETYTQSGTYLQTIKNAKGCDSTITLHLTIIPPVYDISDSSCGSYTLNGETYTQSGTYQQILNNAAGCDSTITLHLTIKAPPKDSTLYFLVCRDEKVMVGANEYTKPGTFTSVFTSANGCDSNVIAHISHMPAINPNIEVEIPVLYAYPLTADNYQWLDCRKNIEPIDGANEQTFEPPDNGEYAVSVTIDECTEVSPCIKYSRQSEIYLPTAFSPNGDGVNDTYKPVYEGWLINKMSVFNRWGELIYESTDPNASWDGSFQGQLVPQGVYTILIVFQAMESKGSVQLIEQRNVLVQLLR